MDYRKLVKFGQSSFVISLPKEWIVKNKLGKGSIIYVDQKPRELRIFTEETAVEEKKEITIETSNKNLGQIRKEIIAAYLNNYSIMNIVGSSLKDNLQEIREIIHGLVAVEAVEQSSDRIIAEDFLDMKTQSIDSLIQRMDVTLRAMFTEFTDGITIKGSKTLVQRDKDVNRLYFLSIKVLRYFLDNPQHDVSGVPNSRLASKWWVVTFMENIGDDIKSLGNALSKLKNTGEEGKIKIKFIKLIATIYEFYLKTMKFGYKNDAASAYKLSDDKNSLKKSVILLTKEIKKYDIDKEKITSDYLVVGSLTEMSNSLIENVYSILKMVFNL
jgi:phosphate uptake regulator